MMPSSLVQNWKASSASLSVDRDVGDAAGILEPGVLGADSRIVETGRDRVAFEDLPVVVLQVDRCGCHAARRDGRRSCEAACPFGTSRP